MGKRMQDINPPVIHESKPNRWDRVDWDVSDVTFNCSMIGWMGFLVGILAHEARISWLSGILILVYGLFIGVLITKVRKKIRDLKKVREVIEALDGISYTGASINSVPLYTTSSSIPHGNIVFGATLTNNTAAPPGLILSIPTNAPKPPKKV